jgi:hypothetical protein
MKFDVPIVKLNFISLIFSMFALGMAFGLTVAVFILFAVQVIVFSKCFVYNYF